MDFTMEVAKQTMLKKLKDTSNYSSSTNLLISPLSLNLVLNMLTANMPPGEALEKLTSLLGAKTLEDVTAASSSMMALQCHVESGYEDDNEPGYDSEGEMIEYSKPSVLALVNGAWAAKHYQLQPYFQKVIKDVYEGDLRFVDFVNEGNKVVDEVNTWAKTATKGHIKQLLEPNSFNEFTFLVLANALYFKATWMDGFSKSKTEERDFHLLDGRRVSVPFMGGKEEFRMYAAFDGFKVLRLPYDNSYKTKRFSMYIFLPDKTHGLADLIQRIGSKPGFLNQDFKKMNEYVHLSELWVPKFKFSYLFEASNDLKELGVELAFGEVKDVVILQKACIEVDEVGTVGAAVSSDIILGCDEPEITYFTKECFVADHPFMFMIREEISKLVVFTGAMLDPSSCEN